MQRKNKIIILFGFSGSGKSTLADMLGKEYGLRVIHPSSILRNLLEGKTVNANKTKSGKGFWESEKGVRLFKERLKEQHPLDMDSDKILLKELSKGNVVMDSWSMPWLFKKGLRIYLKGTLPERAGRVSRRSKVSFTRALGVVKMKDEETRKMFKRVYGFDIKKDLQVFDFILDTTKLNKKQVFTKVLKFLKKKRRQGVGAF